MRQHNDLAPAAIEQQVTNHYSSRLWHDSSFKKNVVRQHNVLALRRLSKNKLLISFLKNVVRQHNDLAPAAIEQQ